MTASQVSLSSYDFLATELYRGELNLERRTADIYVAKSVLPDNSVLFTAVFLSQKEKTSLSEEIQDICSQFDLSKGILAALKMRSPSVNELVRRMRNLVDSLDERPFSWYANPFRERGSRSENESNVFGWLMTHIHYHLGYQSAKYNVFVNDSQCATKLSETIRGRRNSAVESVRLLQGRSEPGLLLADFAGWAEYRRQRQEIGLEEYRAGLNEFQKWIRTYPLLGAAHKMGERILKGVKRQRTKTLSDSHWMRARLVNSPDVLKASDMGAPPRHLVRSEGRYNHIGMPVLYLASDADTCAAEMLEPGETKLLWLQEFLVNKKVVLDLTVGANVTEELQLEDAQLLLAALLYSGLVGETPDREQVWKPEYYVPRYVADATRSLRGVDGILYNSSRGPGQNLALFNYDVGVSPEGGPQVREMSCAPWAPNHQTCIGCGARIYVSSTHCPMCGTEIALEYRDYDGEVSAPRPIL